MNRATAIERLREAQVDWNEAIFAHERAMPELRAFAARLRATSKAADKQAKALKYAAEAGLRALAKDTVDRHPPRELDPAANRPGDPDLWQNFDAAVREWQAAWRSGSTLTVAQALDRLSILTEMLADSVDEQRRSTSAASSESGPAQERRAVGQ